MSTFFSSLATHINDEFKAVLPVINTIVSDMVSNDVAWNANPVVKSTEAVAALVNPIAAVDAQVVIGAVSLVQALWQTFGGGNAAPATTSAANQVLVQQPAQAEEASTASAAANTLQPAGPGVASDMHAPVTTGIPQVPATALEAPTEESHM